MPIDLLPMSLLNSLADLPREVAVAGLLRHAERQVILPGEFGNNVNLTGNGEMSCQLLARKLSKQLLSLYSSPVRRCRQTAELLSSAAKFPQIQTSQLLGDPGIFIVNRHEAHIYFRQHNPLMIAHRLVSKQKNPAGFCCCTKETTYQLIHYLLQHVTEPGLSLFITHDSILSVVLGIIFEETVLESLWPTYLEGLFLWRQQNFLHLIYRNQCRKVLWIN